MLDVEPTTGSAPTVADVATFIAAYRKLGGMLHLIYLPHWYWLQLGSPSLSFLNEADLRIVSSQYQTYTKTGGGWNSYGGATPAIWQYSDSVSFDGFRCDFNAYRGSLVELKSIARTGHLPVDPPVLKNAVNPVKGLQVEARYTQAGVTWHAAPGAKSYRVILRKGLKKIVTREGTRPEGHFVNLKPGTEYSVTVLALPAKLTDTISGRARGSFTTKK
jgi:hypothetical protein